MLGRTTIEQKRFPAWFAGALAMLFVLNAIAAVVLLRPPQFEMILDPSQMRPELGAAWLAPVQLGNAVFPVDGDRDAPALSNLRLFENSVELTPGRSPHADIREKGAGRFSHWHEWIYFSTSDGTDPRSNGRVYSVSIVGMLSTHLLLALAVVDLLALAALRMTLIRRYGGSTVGASSSDAVPILSPLALAALVTAAAFCLAWWCGFVYRTNDEFSMRRIAEGAGLGPSEFLIYQNVMAGLLLRALYSIAPHLPWYDLVLAAGNVAGALLLMFALLRLCWTPRATIFCTVLGLIVFTVIFQKLQFTAAANMLAAGATALAASMAFRPPASRRRLHLGAAAVAIAFFWGSLFRFEAALLAAALAGPILLLWTRQSLVTWRLPLLGFTAGILLAVSGKGFDIAYYKFTPGWEHYQAEKSHRLRVSEYLHADLSREPEMKAALAAVGWSRNDYDLISTWMFALPDIFSVDRLARFAELAPRKSWSERVAYLYEVLQRGRPTIFLFAALCLLALVMVRSLFAVTVMLVSAAWFAMLTSALSILFKASFLHVLWIMCGTVTLVAATTVFAGTRHIRRQGYRLVEDNMIAIGALAALSGVALWQIGDMWTQTRTRDDRRTLLERDLNAWTVPPDARVIGWGGGLDFDTWVRPFHVLPPQTSMIFFTVHSSVAPLADPIYASWGTKDTLWALCHVPQTYLVDGQFGHIVRQSQTLSTYMQEHHGEAVKLVPVIKGKAASLFACRPADKAD